MSNSDQPAYPRGEGKYDGLSKLELLAAMFMQGLLSTNMADTVHPEFIADIAIIQADALLSQLEKTKQ